MKRIIHFLLFSGICIFGFAQSGNDHPMPDSTTVVSLPWYNNNQYLINHFMPSFYYHKV